MSKNAKMKNMPMLLGFIFPPLNKWILIVFSSLYKYNLVGMEALSYLS